jgi:putative transposase
MPKARRLALGKGELHFITCASYRHLPKLGVEKHRALFCQLLEELRVKFRFEVVGYVVMPAAVQVLISEPEKESAESVMQALRQRYQRRYNVSARSEEPAWEKSMSDTHVVGADHILACLGAMHQAPVKAGLVEGMADWEWSSARRYAGLPEGVVTVEPFADARARVPS